MKACPVLNNDRAKLHKMPSDQIVRNDVGSFETHMNRTLGDKTATERKAVESEKLNKTKCIESAGKEDGPSRTAPILLECTNRCIDNILGSKPSLVDATPETEVLALKEEGYPAPVAQNTVLKREGQVLQPNMRNFLLQSPDEMALSLDDSAANAIYQKSHSGFPIQVNGNVFSCSEIMGQMVRGEKSNIDNRLPGNEISQLLHPKIWPTEFFTNQNPPLADCIYAELQPIKLESPVTLTLSLSSKRGQLEIKTLRLQLHPENLGTLLVSLKQHDDGISITIRAETPEAHAKMSAGGEELARSLDALGVTVTKIILEPYSNVENERIEFLGASETNIHFGEGQTAHKESRGWSDTQKNVMASDIGKDNEPIDGIYI